jgi:hypothetical protein
MLYVLDFMLSHFFPAVSYRDKLRLQCASTLVDMYREMEKWGPESGTKVASLARRHLLLYSELSSSAEASCVVAKGKSWKLYPKRHMLQHCIEDQVSLAGNPRDHWTYADESCIGQIAKLAEKCHSGTVHRVVMLRYRASHV